MSNPAFHKSSRRKAPLQVLPRTLIEIAITGTLLVGVATLLASSSKPYVQNMGMWVNPFMACVAISFWRFKLAQLPAPSMRLAMFAVLIVLTLPYIYYTGALIADSYRIPASKWLGDPVWVYTVPTVSFVTLDLRFHPRHWRNFLTTSMIELFIAIPVWTVICLLLQGYLNWFQMG